MRSHALLRTGESMVDLRQAAIGPGMAVFSRFAQVFDGSEPIRVRAALAIINQVLGQVLDEHSVSSTTRRGGRPLVRGPRLRRGAVRRRPSSWPRSTGSASNGWWRPGSSSRAAARSGCSARAELPADVDPATERTPVWEATPAPGQAAHRRCVSRRAAGAELLAALGEAAGARELAQYLANSPSRRAGATTAIAVQRAGAVVAADRAARQRPAQPARRQLFSRLWEDVDGDEQP